MFNSTLTHHNLDMGGAKSALEVQDDLTFLDIIIRQVEHLNRTERVEVPLLLMTSFNTEEDTLRIVKTYANRDVKITTFNQSRYPRLTKDSLLPLAKSVQDGKASWYPPGHGDLYNSLHRSGVLDRLIGEGKEYLFISNSDNLGAVSVLCSNLCRCHLNLGVAVILSVDQRILQYMIESDSEFVMEVTDKTKRDIKVRLSYFSADSRNDVNYVTRVALSSVMNPFLYKVNTHV